MKYHLLLTDDETGEPRARVSYRIRIEDESSEDSVIVDEIIPAGYQLSDADEMECRHHAERLALDERRLPEPEPLKFEPESTRLPIRWGVKG